MARFRGEHAAFIGERRVIGEAPPDAGSAVAEWQRSAHLDDRTFATRLASAGFTRATFAAVVGRAPFAADPVATAWVAELHDVLATPPSFGGSAALRLYGEHTTRIPFEGLLSRFAARYAVRLVAEADPASTDLAVRLYPSLVEGLLVDLWDVAHRTLVFDVHRAAGAGLLRGRTPHERYDHYDREVLADTGRAEALFTEFPVLGRALVEHAGAWLAASAELLEHLVTDLPALRRYGLAPDLPVELVECGLGDRHLGGRSVARIEFADGSSLIHKPRPVEAEQLYADVVALLDELVPGMCLHAMRTVPRDGYGWCEYLERTPCRDRDAVRRYHRHVGGALAALHVLGAVDIHMGNLIAAGESPVPVDLETILQHTSVRDRTALTANELAIDMLAQSVLATAMVPSRLFGDGMSAGVDISGISGGAPQRSPRALPTLIDPFTDRMRIEGRHREMRGARNRPVLDGVPVDPAAWTGDIVEGFTDAYEAVHAHAGRFDALVQDASDITVRYLARTTRRYDLFRYERYHPDYLTDGLDTERLLEKLWTAVTTRSDLAPIVESERAQLLAGDIPSFSSRPGSTDLYSGGTVVAEDYFDQPSAVSIRRTLALFGPDHRAVQLTVLDDSLGLIRDRAADRFDLAAHQPATADGPVVGRDQLAELARRALDGLADRAMLGEDDCTWIGVATDGIRDESLTFKPLTTNLYDGLGGMALVFAHAARALGVDSYAEIARRSAQPLITELRGAIADGATRRVGAFGGLAGSLYALDHVEVSIGAVAGTAVDEDWTDLLAASLPYLARCAARESSPDLVSGLAGCAAVAAGLATRHDLPGLADVAAICVEGLHRSAVPAGDGLAWRFGPEDPLLGGFSHGAAGIGWALLRTARVFGDDRAHDLGERALAYDAGLRIPDVAAWQDLRDFRDRTGVVQKHPTLWCHGATGIGISRVLAHASAGPGAGSAERYLAEARVAVDAVIAAGSLASQGLCHGDAGSIEFLRLAASVPQLGSHVTVADRQRALLEAHLVRTLEADGFRFGRVSGRNVPGLMMGRAGVCLELLRMIDDRYAPAVLWLGDPDPEVAP